MGAVIGYAVLGTVLGLIVSFIYYKWTGWLYKQPTVKSHNSGKKAWWRL